MKGLQSLRGLRGLRGLHGLLHPLSGPIDKHFMHNFDSFNRSIKKHFQYFKHKRDNANINNP